MKVWKQKWFRITVGILIPLTVLLGALLLYVIGYGPPCNFHTKTGLYCPGCGMGRATVALLHLNLWDAFRYNPPVILLLPLIVYYLIKWYVWLVAARDILPDVNLDWVKIWVVVLLTVAAGLFYVLRNLPVAPFTYFAPDLIL
ncbi:MAG: DUF2752 domain-containing protein [Clostridia bacterium]|nr:DUF2752 domain-containing protein [Clostridia bacterium]